MNRYEEIISSFGKARIGVIGDMVADVYVLGYPDRLSREAPVMVVRREEERLIPGCAANTVCNLVDLGCSVVPVSALGTDEYGTRLRECLEERGLSMGFVIQRSDLHTVSKTRIMVGEANRTKQQVIRLDQEVQAERPDGFEEQVLDVIEEADRGVDAWLVSDYDYFMISSRVARRLVETAGKKPLIVDSRFRCGLFRSARCLTPNESEAVEASGINPEGEQGMESVGWKLMDEFEPESLLITRGNKGMLVFEKSGSVTAVPAVGGDEVVDVTGAGDTVAATVMASIAAGASTVEAARLASCAAGVVVMKTGAATLGQKELLSGIGFLQ